MWESEEPRQMKWGKAAVLPESEALLTPLVLTAGDLREPAIHPSVSGGIDVIGKSRKRDSAPSGSWWTEALGRGCQPGM